MNSLLTAGALSVLALAANFADVGGGESGFTAFWTGVVLLALAATARSVLQADFGSAVAWGYIAVFISLAPFLLALPLTHAASLWDRSTCDPFQPCAPAGPTMWAPALLYAASVVFTWRAVRACKAERPIAS
jgi:hypothetical protein